jgi:hypothetical protein
VAKPGVVARAPAFPARFSTEKILENFWMRGAQLEKLVADQMMEGKQRASVPTQAAWTKTTSDRCVRIWKYKAMIL